MAHIVTIHAYPNNYLVSELLRVADRLTLVVPHGFDASELQNVDEILFCDLDNDEDLLRDIRALHARCPVEAIVPIYEGSVLSTALVARDLQLPHCALDAAKKSRDKHASYQCWHQAGLPVPLTFPVGQLSDPDMSWQSQLPYPVIVKPVDAMSSQGVVKVSSDQAFLAAVEQITQHIGLQSRGFERSLYKFGQFELPLIVQEFCPGEELGIDLYVDGDTEVLLGVFQKANAQGPYFPESMSVSPSNFEPALELALFELAAQAVRALGLTCGVAHVEIRMTDSGPKILEAGLRPGGAYTAAAIALLLGVSSLELQARLYLGLSVELPERTNIGAVLYGGVLYPDSGTLTGIEGLEVFEQLSGVKEVKQLNQVGDVVRAMPNSAQPHLLYYLLSSATREDALQIHERIQSQVRPIILPDSDRISA
ncbi:ATP-grasp domain-containing protein [Pseudoalteromonas sp. DL2-H2.2]|uniref:ATP-grasp domain-containing protein n=1 Tax=Pseudoalteromonas sp. DL2-H2.2 TaxID=2908889 RepID=UPI001F425D35|nr:ATP-grasp domain-containing protein [Pseudoalteromonas sp. DL2-H2.2]MCF2910386.1 ATP-grasp domain-containing protein [Pseudoalteromonas sp. DL2-H2.2]